MSISSSWEESGFLFFPYKEIIGSWVFSSMLLFIIAPSSAEPLKPCSGVNIFFILIPWLKSVSIRWIPLKILVWFAITPTFLSWRSDIYNSIREAPTIASSASIILLLLLFCPCKFWQKNNNNDNKIKKKSLHT